jgi:hypothetical protein
MRLLWNALGWLGLLAGLAVLGEYDLVLTAAPVAVLLLAFTLGCFPGEARVLRALARFATRPRHARTIGRPRRAARTAMYGGRLMATGWATRPPPPVRLRTA